MPIDTDHQPNRCHFGRMCILQQYRLGSHTLCTPTSKCQHMFQKDMCCCMFHWTGIQPDMMCILSMMYRFYSGIHMVDMTHSGSIFQDTKTHKTH